MRKMVDDFTVGRARMRRKSEQIQRSSVQNKTELGKVNKPKTQTFQT